MAKAFMSQTTTALADPNRDDGVYQYDIGPGGELSPKSPPTVAAGFFPLGVAVTPDGQSVYVTNALGNDVSQYDVGAGGVLVPKSPPTVPAGNQPERLEVSPDGTSAYVVNSGDYPANGSVSEYDIDPVSGALSPKSPPMVPAGVVPKGIAVSSDGQSAYVANQASQNVSQYEVGTGGELSLHSPATTAAGRSPTGVAVSPAARPTTKENCRHGGWREFGFTSKRQCIRFVKRHAREDCRAERDASGREAFREKHGRGKHHRRAMRRCVKQTVGAG